MPSLARIFGKHIPIAIPAELDTEVTLLAHLGVSPKSLSEKRLREVEQPPSA